MLNGEGNKNCKKKKKKKSVVYYNMKHSSYTFYGKKVSYQRFCCLCSCSVFFTAAGFYLTGFLLTASISHFLTADIKFSCWFSNKIRLFCLFISHSSSFCVIHVSVNIQTRS